MEQVLALENALTTKRQIPPIKSVKHKSWCLVKMRESVWFGRSRGASGCSARALSTILCQAHLQNPLCSLLGTQGSSLCPFQEQVTLTAPSSFPFPPPVSKLSVVDLIQPGGRAGREIRVPAAAAGGEVGARSIPSQDPHGLGHPLSALSHDGQAVVWVNQAGD